MIHYHGTPIGGSRQDVARFLPRRRDRLAGCQPSSESTREGWRLIMRYGRKRLHSAEYRAAERLAQKHQRKTKFWAGVGQYGYSRSDFNAIAVGRQARETTHFFATTY